LFGLLRNSEILSNSFLSPALACFGKSSQIGLFEKSLTPAFRVQKQGNLLFKGFYQFQKFANLLAKNDEVPNRAF